MLKEGRRARKRDLERDTGTKNLPPALSLKIVYYSRPNLKTKKLFEILKKDFVSEWK